MAPLVSIVTRTRDRPRLLPRALASVLAQSTPDWEHFIVNDGGDPAVIEELLEPHRAAYGERLRVVHREGSAGMEAAANAAVAQATGTWITIHDDDDAWTPGFLECMLAAAENHLLGARLGGIVCHTTRVVEKWDVDHFATVQAHPFNPWLRDRIDLWRMAQENCFPPISLLVRRSAGESVGWFDESLRVLGDWEFNLRLLRRFEIAVLPEALAFYHHREPEVVDAEANTVTAGDRLHRETEVKLRRKWETSGDPFWRQLARASESGADMLSLAAEVRRLEDETNHLRGDLARFETAFRP